MAAETTRDPVRTFFANALIGIGWLILGLGGLCTLIFGAVSLGGGEFHASLGDWMLPGSMLAIGGGFLGTGRAIRRSLAKTGSPSDAEARRPIDE